MGFRIGWSISAPDGKPEGHYIVIDRNGERITYLAQENCGRTWVYRLDDVEVISRGRDSFLLSLDATKIPEEDKEEIEAQAKALGLYPVVK